MADTVNTVCEIVARLGMCNVTEIANAYAGHQPGTLYLGVLTLQRRPPTINEEREVRRALLVACKQGRLRKLGSGRWTQYTLPEGS